MPNIKKYLRKYYLIKYLGLILINLNSWLRSIFLYSRPNLNYLIHIKEPLKLI